MKTSITIFFLLFSLAAFGQVESPGTNRKRTEGFVEEIKNNDLIKDFSSNDSLKLSKQIADTVTFSGKEVLKDSLANRFDVLDSQLLNFDSTSVDKVKQQIRTISLDSLNNQKLLKDNEYLQEALFTPIDSTTSYKLTQQIKTISLDSLNNQKLFKENAFLQEVLKIPIDSTTTKKVKNQIKATAIDSLNNQKFIRENEYIGDVKELEQLKDIPKDSLGGYIKDEAVERGEQYLKSTEEYKALTGMEEGEGLSAMEDYKAQLEQQQKEWQEAIAKDELKQKLATQGKQFVSEHMDQIQQVQEQMGKLKQKYNEVADSQDLTTAVKRTSLEGESFWKRMVLGGNFNITRTNPLSVDVSPVLGYRFNKIFEAGVTAAYRTQFRAERYNVIQGKEEVLGFSAFASHMVFKGFFGYVESERLLKSGNLLETSFKKWHQTLLVGIGRSFHITSWLDMQTLIVVNVLHDNKDALYNDRVLFKTGFRKRN